MEKCHYKHSNVLYCLQEWLRIMQRGTKWASRDYPTAEHKFCDLKFLKFHKLLFLEYRAAEN